ncbi:MAG: ATP-dependent metallopeptidase FtsH/Yme1/Tma family protein, partial [Chitinivibrionales bacterium]
MLLWAFIFAAIFYYMFNIMGERERVQLSYTGFKRQVARGNVESVTMRGRQIDGAFRNSYHDTTAAQDTVAFQNFQTVRPAVEDEGFIPFLENNNVTIHAETEDNPWMPYLMLLVFILPWVLIIFYTMHVSKRIQGGQGGRGGFGGGGLFNVGRSRAKKFNKAKIHSSYEDVAGLRNAKKDLQEIVEYLKVPTKFVQLGAEIPK